MPDDFLDPARHLADADSRYGFRGGVILHPSDMSLDEGRAFVHALALALRLESRLEILHADADGATHDPAAFPHVRETLVRWGLLERGASQDDVFDELGVDVKKISRTSSPLQAIEDSLDSHAVDMLVLAARSSGGLPKWLGLSVSQRLARGAPTRMLFVPCEGRGFVSPSTGAIRLRRVVVPLAQRPDPRLSLFAAPRIAQVLGQQDVEFIAVHVGDLAERPDVALPEPSELGRWTWEQRSGSVSDGIVAVATEREADLIAMVTEGARGVAEVFGGSTTSQVLRHAPCSLLATPARMFEGGDAAAPPPA